MTNGQNDDLWQIMPDAPECEKILGHPDWLFEDPLTTGYPMRVEGYPLEKLSQTVAGMKYAMFSLDCDATGYCGFIMRAPFIRYLMGVPLPQLAEEFREFIFFYQDRRFIWPFSSEWGVMCS